MGQQSFPHDLWHFDEEVMSLGADFWQHTLGVDYEEIRLIPQHEGGLTARLGGFSVGLLHSLVSALGLSTESDAKSSLIQIITEQAQTHPFVTLLLLTDACVHRIRYDVRHVVTKMLVEEYGLTVDVLHPDATTIVCLNMLSINRNALRFYRLVNTAESVTYQEYTLIPDVDDENHSYEQIDATRRAIESGVSLATLTTQHVNGVLSRVFPEGGEHRATCLGLRYDERDDSVTVFILKESRRSHLQEFGQFYYGTETEDVILEFRRGIRKGRFRAHKMTAEKIANHLSTTLLKHNVRYVEADHGSSKEDVHQLFVDLERNRARLFCLTEINIKSLPVEGGPTVMLREGPGGHHVGASLAELRDKGLDWLQDLVSVSKVKVRFRSSEEDADHIFDLYVIPLENGNNDNEELLVTFSSSGAPRRKRNEFTRNLQERYSVNVIPTIRS